MAQDTCEKLKIGRRYLKGMSEETATSKSRIYQRPTSEKQKNKKNL